MIVVRRIYLYAVSLVSLETVLWGVIGLVRSLFHPGQGGTDVARLAGALALILVGIPVFLIHWRIAQRLALQDTDERFSRTRAVFLYGTLTVALVPLTLNILALLNRLGMLLFSLPQPETLLGSGQSSADNLVAILFNALAAGFFLWVLRSDWRAPPINEVLPEVRRLFRYLWLLYGIGLTVAGTQQLLKTLLDMLHIDASYLRYNLANSLALGLLGVALWIFFEWTIRRSLVEPAENSSVLRLVVLYGLVFSSLLTLLICAGMVLSVGLSLLLGGSPAWQPILSQLSAPASFAVPMAVVWLFYRRSLRLAEGVLPEQPLRLALRRLYLYLFSFLGLAAASLGLLLSLDAALELAFGRIGLSPAAWGDSMRTQLAASLAAFAVGLPVWLVTWSRIQKDALREGEAGDRARSSLIRKTYLYLVLFSGVIGMMVSAGSLIYQVLRYVLGDPAAYFPLEVARWTKTLLVFALLAGYFWRTLRSDSRLAERSLTRRHAQFPVLVLAPDESSDAVVDNSFSATLVAALERQAPGLPIAVHPASQGVPDELLSAARAVIVPAALLVRLPESLRLWLQSFNGARLVVPTPAQGWLWAGGSRSASSLASQAAQTVQRLAEGEPPAEPRLSSAFQVILYVLAGLFVLEILFLIVSFFAQLLIG